jgi:YHS domain-containing protein
MRRIRLFLLSVILLLAVPASAFAQDYTRNTPGLAGYDPVAYFTDGKPLRGSGNHVTIQDGVTYAFTTEEHKKMFEANPQKYLPAYGGYCAYGVAVGKKFVVDPEAWKIVDGKLYLVMDKDIKKAWEKDIPGHIKKAEANWSKIKDSAPGDCGTDYHCVSDLAAHYRQQASDLQAIAQRYEVEANFQAAQNGKDSQQAKQSRDLAKQLALQAQEADERARELRSQLPHGVAN